MQFSTVFENFPKNIWDFINVKKLSYAWIIKISK